MNELAELRETLRESEMRFRSVVQSAIDAIITGTRWLNGEWGRHELPA